LKEVDPGLLAAMKGEEIAEAFEELDPDMRGILNEPDPAKLLNDLAEEYAALFIVPGGISLYESTRIHGMLNQKPSWEVEEFYRRCGLVVRQECSILPDHLGMEFDFMGYLAGKEAAAMRSADEEHAVLWRGMQENFFCSHIDPWAFALLRDLRKLAFHPFYKAVGSLAIQFLETEKEYFGIPRGGEENRFPQLEVNRV
jgi:TorA maturation chaperone TorD